MSIEEKIAQIEARNNRVSIDKAWEKSKTRRASIILITYLCASIVFIFVIPTPEWYLAALVPVLGYALSTLGLPQIRKIWERKNDLGAN